jgi:hypothetical protein
MKLLQNSAGNFLNMTPQEAKRMAQQLLEAAEKSLTAAPGRGAGFVQHLRNAQNSLDRMPTYGIANMGAADWRGTAPADVMYNKSLAEGTSEAERAVFEELRRLNAEVVLRVLVMRNLAVAAQIGR